jgi:chromosomal replication initiation ATPase DnaA
MAAGPQLALPFEHRPDYRSDTFIRAPSNALAVTWLERSAEWPDRRLALWGESGCGKTHLLRIWVRRTGAAVWSGAALPALATPPPPEGIALDDADRFGAEEPLLHLLNACREAGVPLLMTAATPPARWPVRLPDLGSRLCTVTAVPIGRPDDALLRDLLDALLLERRLAVSAAVRDWLLLRLPRAAAALRDAVQRLDHASLAARRPISRSLAADTLGLDAPDDNSASYDGGHREENESPVP